VLGCAIGIPCGMLLDPPILIVLSVAELILFVTVLRVLREDGPTARQVRR
jgi:hypothetical protein